MKKRVWITGAGGLIGSCLARLAPAGFEIISLARADLDLTDFKAVENRFRLDSPRLAIHCAAMSKSPACQANPKEAWKINTTATEHLAGLAAAADFIFFSTDLVFDGRKGNYVETDETNPLSVYAETKVAAERIVLQNPRHAVVRTSINSGASPNGNSAYNEQMRETVKAGQPLRLFCDEYRSPIPAVVTARAIWELAAWPARGLFHLAGAEKMSRAEIGQLFAERHPECNVSLQISSLREYTGAPRSPDTSLNSAKLGKLLSFSLPGLGPYLREHPDEIF